MTADDYVNAVLDEMPRAATRREQIAAELRAHVAQRVADGHTLDDVLRQLGDPIALAESYLSADPLVAAPLGERVLAKLIDLAVVTAFVVPVAALLAFIVPLEAIPFIILVLVILAVTVFLWLYTVIAESQTGQTVGKRARGIHVVDESGRRASLGQAFVRQLPVLFNVYWIDAMFALFTEKSQRAFEVLSKTRVVRVSAEGGSEPVWTADRTRA
jgi:uncharacterized RDD family membrane protein YckC